jgi:membrane protein required for colicin V production
LKDAVNEDLGMDGFTLVDGGVALLVLISGVLAYSRGLVREIMAILGWVAAAVVAFIFAPQAEPLIKEIPILNEFLGDSCELSIIAAFAAVFALTLIVVSIFAPLFSSAVQRSALGGVDQGLGFLFGVLRGLVLVAIALIVYDRIVLDQRAEIVDNSQTAKIFANVQANLENRMPETAPEWVTERYEELVGSCGDPAPSSN